MCKNWKPAGQLAPRFKAGMRLGLGHKEAKSGLPSCPEHEVSFALGMSVGGRHSPSCPALCLLGKPNYMAYG